MKTLAPALDERATRTLDHELAVVRSAVELVAAGVFPRVTCAGLSFAPQLAAEAAAAAGAIGVRVRPLWTIGETESALVVERADGDG